MGRKVPEYDIYSIRELIYKSRSQYDNFYNINSKIE